MFTSFIATITLWIKSVLNIHFDLIILPYNENKTFTKIQIQFDRKYRGKSSIFIWSTVAANIGWSMSGNAS